MSRSNTAFWSGKRTCLSAIIPHFKIWGGFVNSGEQRGSLKSRGIRLPGTKPKISGATLCIALRVGSKQHISVVKIRKSLLSRGMRFAPDLGSGPYPQGIKVFMLDPYICILHHDSWVGAQPSIHPRKEMLQVFVAACLTSTANSCWLRVMNQPVHPVSRSFLDT